MADHKKLRKTVAKALNEALFEEGWDHQPWKGNDSRGLYLNFAEAALQAVADYLEDASEGDDLIELIRGDADKLIDYLNSRGYRITRQEDS